MNCKLCGMLYIPENPDDVREHKKYHNKIVNGLPALPSESDCVIWSQDDMQIIVIDKSLSVEQLRQAEEVARLARIDTPYGAEVLFGEDELDTRVFLLHRHNRNIGLLIMEKRDHIWKTSWDDIDAGKNPKELLEPSFMWSICFIWILKSIRGFHLGKTMLEAALVHLGVNYEVVGWYTPFTDSGKVFVRSCCPDVFYIAK